MFKKLFSLVLAIVMVGAAFVSCDVAQGELLGLSESPLPAPAISSSVEIPSDFKIGFICLHDENSTYDNNFLKAVQSVKTALGLTDEQVVIKTNIPESNDCYVAAKDLAGQGCDIVFANSFGHEPFILQAAQEFPEVEFCHATGTKAHTSGLSNFHNAFASIYEGRYLAGIAAGLKLNEMIAAGEITADEAVMGYVGAFTYAEVMSGFTSFYLGAKSVCPTVKMKVQYTGSWYNEALEQEAANALLAAGCVLISQHADSMGAPSACEVKGVPNVSYNGSTYDACPETFIVSSAINWAPYYTYIIESVVNGTPIAADWCGGIKEGSVVLSGINLDVAAEGTVEAINNAIAGFKAGTLKVFDVSKDNFITLNGAKITTYMADVDDFGDYVAETEAIKDGYFNESGDRSAPYFNILIDGITNLNTKY
ncbi:MAG: BMP family ABC transporter substrate-binding protein [Clostridia bacterium]|nr:BMP family ABC transporter substrate-binding protein [Clostridia bacterium]